MCLAFAVGSVPREELLSLQYKGGLHNSEVAAVDGSGFADQEDDADSEHLPVHFGEIQKIDDKEINIDFPPRKTIRMISIKCIIYDFL